MIMNPIVLGLLWSSLLGLLVLGVLLRWLEQYHPLPLFTCTLFGFLVVLSMPGLLGLGAHLVCWLTTACLSPLIPQAW